MYIVEIPDMTGHGAGLRSNGRLRLFRSKVNMPGYEGFAGLIY